MSAALSTPDSAILTNVVPLDPLLLASTSASSHRPVRDLYDVASTAKRILEADASKIALQFPDELLADAVPIYWALRGELEREEGVDKAKQRQLYIMADTSYGNCCVDEVTAQHVSADLVIHYGHTCLSPTSRLPVVYVLSKLAIDEDRAAEELSKAALAALGEDEDDEAVKAVVLTYDVGYAHAAEGVGKRLKEVLQATQGGNDSSGVRGKERASQLPLSVEALDTSRNYRDRIGSVKVCSGTGGAGCSSGRCAQDEKESGCGGDGCCGASRAEPRAEPSDDSSSSGPVRDFGLPSDVPLSKALTLYIGGESLALTNLLLRAGPFAKVISYDPASPSSTRREDGRTNRLLMRRYAAVQKARDASVIGLLVGTLGVKSYLPLLSHLRRLIVQRGDRKVYTISVGRLTPAKLANFQEIDVFVLLACPENSLLDAVDPTGRRSKDFYRPIVTPFEMELALRSDGEGGRVWDGSYELELETLLKASKEADAKQPADEEAEQDDGRPHFSLVSGGYVSRARYGTNDTATTTAGTEGDASQTALVAASKDDSLASNGAVVVRNADGTLTRVMDSAGGKHLAGRTWTGLEARVGMDRPAPLEEGRAGWAGGYEALGGKEGEGRTRE